MRRIHDEQKVKMFNKERIDHEKSYSHFLKVFNLKYG